MIRDEVVYTEILEQAGQLMVKYESIHGAIKRLCGFAWVVVHNVAVSRVRRGPHLLEQPIAGSAEAEAALAGLTAEDGSPERIENSIFVREALAQISDRERKIAILKKAGFSTKEIAKALDMSVSAVDTTYARLLEKLRRLFGSGSDTKE
jgi:RNA polymerase sigma factor (sigma-70 family)